MTAEPKRDATPAELALAMTEALHGMVEHATTIAHIKRVFYNAYITEGFTPAEALELCKKVIEV